ncbi:MAG: RNA polymerase sigma factor [Candidatus Kapabacteria bacterium]|nr:RNA polymerase sigma factor [Candidatus Kapabacteria bacterium]
MNKHTLRQSADSDDELYAKMCRPATKEAAFTALYHRYKGRVYGYCRKVVGETVAGDILQETFVRFYTSAHTDREMKNVIGFLMTIARNLCLNHKERNDNTLVEFRDMEDIEIPDMVGDFKNDDELRVMIENAMNLLSEEYREAVYLQLYSGLSYQEIGEMTGKPVTTVRNRIVRAKTKLRELLASVWEEYQP